MRSFVRLEGQWSSPTLWLNTFIVHLLIWCRTPMEYYRTLVVGEFILQKHVSAQIRNCNWCICWDAIGMTLRLRSWSVQVTVLWPCLLVIDFNIWRLRERTSICKHTSGKWYSVLEAVASCVRHFGINKYSTLMSSSNAKRLSDDLILFPVISELNDYGWWTFLDQPTKFASVTHAILIFNASYTCIRLHFVCWMSLLTGILDRSIIRYR